MSIVFLETKCRQEICNEFKNVKSFKVAQESNIPLEENAELFDDFLLFCFIEYGQEDNFSACLKKADTIFQKGALKTAFYQISPICLKNLNLNK